MPALAFYFFAALTLFPAIAVVMARQPIYAVFNLILAFFGAAGLFVLLHAEFLSMLLVIVYVGAVAVLFLFVIMMIDLKKQETSLSVMTQLKQLIKSIPGASLIAVLIFSQIIAVVCAWKSSPFQSYQMAPPHEELLNTQSIGMQLYTEHLYAFQTAGLILLVAMIGAIVLTMRYRRDRKRQNISDQVNRTRQDAVELKDVPIGKGVSC